MRAATLYSCIASCLILLEFAETTWKPSDQFPEVQRIIRLRGEGSGPQEGFESENAGAKYMFLLQHPKIASAVIGLSTTVVSAYRLKKNIDSGWPFPIPYTRLPLITFLRPNARFLDKVFFSECRECNFDLEFDNDTPSGFSALDVEVHVGDGESTYSEACQVLRTLRMIDAVDWLTSHSASTAHHPPQLGDALAIVSRTKAGYLISPWYLSDLHEDVSPGVCVRTHTSDDCRNPKGKDGSRDVRAGGTMSAVTLRSLVGNGLEAEIRFEVVWDGARARRQPPAPGASDDGQPATEGGANSGGRGDAAHDAEPAANAASKNEGQLEGDEGDTKNDAGQDTMVPQAGRGGEEGAGGGGGPGDGVGAGEGGGEVRFRVRSVFRRAAGASTAAHWALVGPLHRAAMQEIAERVEEVVRQAVDMSSVRRRLSSETEVALRRQATQVIAKQAAREEARLKLEPKEWRRNNSGRGSGGGFRPETMSRMRKMQHD